MKDIKTFMQHKVYDHFSDYYSETTLNWTLSEPELPQQTSFIVHQLNRTSIQTPFLPKSTGVQFTGDLSWPVTTFYSSLYKFLYARLVLVKSVTNRLT